MYGASLIQILGLDIELIRTYGTLGVTVNRFSIPKFRDAAGTNLF
jgi:hypothetical protein